MAKICTTVEQSKKLVELGLSHLTADMVWSIYGHNGGKVIDGEYRLRFNYEDDTDVPAWSLTALLELMPNDTTLVHYDNVYSMVYDKKPYYVTKKYNNSLDAAFEMVCCLLENKKL